MDLTGRVLVPGTAEGELLRLDEPLSFWGGLRVATGAIIDVHHPQCGAIVSGRIVAMPFARGSSSTANTLAESIHAGTGPAGIVMLAPDEIVVLGATVAGELYGEWIPVVVVEEVDHRRLQTGRRLRVAGASVELLD